MMRRGEGAHEHEGYEEQAAATNYHRKENCQHGATGIGFMSTRQPNAEADERPNEGNDSTANRYDLQRTSRALSKCHNSKSRFKRLVGTANYHQTEVDESTANKKANHDEQRQQDDRTDADSHPCHRGKVVILIRKQADGLEAEREQSRHNAAQASADERVDERLAEAAFALHHTKCFSWTSKHHCQRLYERIEETTLSPVLPRQTGTPSDGCYTRRCTRLHRRDNRRSSPSKLRELRERLPGRHSLAPPDVGGRTTARSQPFAHFLLGEYAETRSSPINVNHRHNGSFY